jgi:hypothetical protein
MDPLTCGNRARGRIRTDDLPITSRMLGVDLDGSRRIWPAHVGWLVDPDDSRWIQTDRLDDQRDDQEPSAYRTGWQGKQGPEDSRSDVIDTRVRRSLTPSRPRLGCDCGCPGAPCVIEVEPA